MKMKKILVLFKDCGFFGCSDAPRVFLIWWSCVLDRDTCAYVS